MSFWDFLPKVIEAGATVYGAVKASDASNKAASQATQASQKSSDVELENLRIAQENLQRNQNAASPGLLALQEQVNRGATLTPDQEIAVEDSRRQSINNLRGGGLRGSARATSAVISDTDNRVRSRFMEQNQNQSDNASRSLSGQYFNAGNAMSNNQANQGQVASRGLTDRGNIQASNTLGQAELRGNAIGDVGAIISDQIKQGISKDMDNKHGGVT